MIHAEDERSFDTALRGMAYPLTVVSDQSDTPLCDRLSKPSEALAKVLEDNDWTQAALEVKLEMGLDLEALRTDPPRYNEAVFVVSAWSAITLGSQLDTGHIEVPWPVDLL